MIRPVREDFKVPKGKKNKRYQNKAYAEALDLYINYLQGIIDGKGLKIPKEQLTLPAHKPCVACATYRMALSDASRYGLQINEICNNALEKHSNVKV